MAAIFLEKEKIRTMKKDLREAGGEVVYPAFSFVEEPATFEKISELETIPEMASFERTPEIILPPGAGPEKEAELLEEPPVPKPESLKTPEPLQEIATEELKPEEQEISKPALEEDESQKISLSELIPQEPETKPLEEIKPAEDKSLEEGLKPLEEAGEGELPSAEELGLEIPEEAPEVAKFKEEKEKINKDHENEEKLRKIAESTLELEDSLKKIAEEKAPFERQKSKVDEEIENIRKKIDLSLERKKKLEEAKKDLEMKESEAAGPDEKRPIEKERWKIENERDKIEKDKNRKEDEIKSLRLQEKEIDLHLDKMLAKEKIALQEMEILKRDRNRILLSQTKEDLEKKLKPMDAQIENIKREMFDNTKANDKTERSLAELTIKEKSVEDEIKVLERRAGETTDEAVSRDIENRRRTIEETRRQLEKDRWDIEDKLKDLEEKRKIIKERYQEIAYQARAIKTELNNIESKIK